MIQITGMNTPQGRAAEFSYRRRNQAVSCPNCDRLGKANTTCPCGTALQQYKPQEIQLPLFS